MPFLRNVTRGRGIPDERLVEVSHHYQALGGASPINEQNRVLRAALAGRTGRAAGCDCRCCGATGTGRRICADVITRGARRRPDPAARAGHLRVLVVLVVPAVPGGLRPGAGRHRTGRLGADRQGAAVLRPARDSSQPFVDGTVDAVRRGDRPPGSTPTELEMVFTTHSIPTTMADTSGSADLGDHRPGGAYVDPASGRRRAR